MHTCSSMEAMMDEGKEIESDLNVIIDSGCQWFQMVPRLDRHVSWGKSTADSSISELKFHIEK